MEQMLMVHHHQCIQRKFPFKPPKNRFNSSIHIRKSIDLFDCKIQMKMCKLKKKIFNSSNRHHQALQSDFQPPYFPPPFHHSTQSPPQQQNHGIGKKILLNKITSYGKSKSTMKFII